MKNAANKMMPAVYTLGICISVSAILWLVLYMNMDTGDAIFKIVIVLAGATAQTAGFIGARRFPQARFWPGACMLAAVPATVYNGLVGPDSVYGLPSNLPAMAELPLLYYVALPIMAAGLLGALLFLVAGLLSLSPDIAGLFDGRKPRLLHQRGAAPAPDTGGPVAGQAPAPPPAPTPTPAGTEAPAPAEAPQPGAAPKEGAESPAPNPE